MNNKKQHLARVRENEIEEFAKEVGRKWYNDGHESVAYASARQGALWADENPKPNLVDIDKATKWFKSWNMLRYVSEQIGEDGYPENVFDMDEFIEDFKKAMEK